MLFIRKVCSLSVIVLIIMKMYWGMKLPFTMQFWFLCSHTYTYSVGLLPAQKVIFVVLTNEIDSEVLQVMSILEKEATITHNEKWNCNIQDSANFYLGIVCAFLVVVDIKVFGLWHCNTHISAHLYLNFRWWWCVLQ